MLPPNSAGTIERGLPRSPARRRCTKEGEADFHFVFESRLETWRSGPVVQSQPDDFRVSASFFEHRGNALH